MYKSTLNIDKKEIGWRPSEFRSAEEVGCEADETEKKNREALQSEITCNFTFVLLIIKYILVLGLD